MIPTQKICTNIASGMGWKVTFKPLLKKKKILSQNLQYIPLSTAVPVHILFTMADTAPPWFIQDDFATEIYEN